MRFPLRDRCLIAAVLGVLCLLAGLSPAGAPRLRVLFLGDDGHHRPADRFRLAALALSRLGIDLTYTDKLTDLNAATLGKYDALLVYANHTKIAPEQEKALLD